MKIEKGIITGTSEEIHAGLKAILGDDLIIKGPTVLTQLNAFLGLDLQPGEEWLLQHPALPRVAEGKALIAREVMAGIKLFRIVGGLKGVTYVWPGASKA